MRAIVWVLLMTVTVAMAASGSNGEVNPVPRHPQASPQTPVPHIIVKLRNANTAAASDTLKVQVEAGRQRVSALIARTGVTLKRSRPITAAMHAIEVEPAGGESAASTLQRLRADPDVEYAEIDQRRYAHQTVTPNDTLFADYQWYMQNASATPAAVDAITAWSTTTGTSTLVIADLDTGVRFEHPDLVGRLISPGYCFISDTFVANNTTCQGPDASDPGDYVFQSDLSHSECSAASASYSSWHGTRTAGLLGAVTNNSMGIAGMTWASQILPLRVLGKCGGVDSDIAAAILYAAGIPVTVTVNGNSESITNPTPAKIINMSLGGTGSCPGTYSDVISQVVAKGVLVVVSAGNEGGPVDAPANCPGVAGVAGLRNAGTKVGYSSLGPQVSLSAPAGNCVNDLSTNPTEPCVYPITSTTNLGMYGPDVNDYTGLYYCDSKSGSTANCTVNTSGSQYRTYNLGTSFSAPIVSGIGALMVAVNGNLNSCELISRLQEGAAAFPQTSTTTTTMCHVPANSSDIQNAECICTQDGQTCGAGMASASGAVRAALRPIAAVALPSSVSSGQTFTLNASGSAAATGRSISSYSWTNEGAQALTLQSAGSASTTVTAPSCGLATVRLTVTDSAGDTDTADVVVSPTSTTSTSPATASGSSSCTLTTPAVQLDVCPATQSIQVKAASQSFTVSVANTLNTAVSAWEVNGIAGGNSTVGTITSAGVYTPPSSVPNPSTVTITAVSAADSAVSGTATVTITLPPKSGGGALDWWTLSCCALLLFANSVTFRARSPYDS